MPLSFSFPSDSKKAQVILLLINHHKKHWTFHLSFADRSDKNRNILSNKMLLFLILITFELSGKMKCVARSLELPISLLRDGKYPKPRTSFFPLKWLVIFSYVKTWIFEQAALCLCYCCIYFLIFSRNQQVTSSNH